MAYSVSAQSGKIAYNVKHYTVDSMNCLKKLTTSAAAGSTAFVVDSSRSFMLNNKRQWVEFLPNGSAADSSIIWDGGTPEGNTGSGCNCGNSSSENQESEYIWDGGEVTDGN